MSPEEKHKNFDRFRGRLAGFVEGCDLDEHKERLIIDMMKDLSYTLEEKTIEPLKP